MELSSVAMLVVGVLMLAVVGKVLFSNVKSSRKDETADARAQRLREERLREQQEQNEQYEQEQRARDNANVLPNGVYTLRRVDQYSMPLDTTTMTVEMVDGTSVGGSVSIVVHYAQYTGDSPTARVILGSKDTVGVVVDIGSGVRRIETGGGNGITLTPSS